MSSVTRNYKGARTGTGAISFYPAGAPAHMLPSATRLDVSSAAQGEQRFALKDVIFAGDTVDKSLAVKITGSATVAFEGTNDDPNDVNAYWFPMATSLTANGVMASTIAAKFVRAAVSAGSGDVVVTYYGEND